VTRLETSPPSLLRTWLIWTAGTVVFPLAGLAGTAAAGRVDSPLSALTGGAVVGLIIGSGQALLSRRRLDPRRWIPATTVGMGLGLLLGAAAVDYRTSLTDLMLMGAITGLLLGTAQTAALPRRTRSRWFWAAAMPVVWALGWAATTLIGVDVEEQFTVVGLSGALTVSALSGLLLHQLLPYRAAVGPRPASTPIEATA
jgi:hypothetical protein